MSNEIRLPAACVVVLVGPSGAGKTAWADEHFPANAVVSSDRLRAMVGESEHDQRAGGDAFDALDLIVERRVARGLLTVIDTLGLDDERRAGYRELARRHGLPCYAIGFDTPAKVCKERNKARSRPVPAKILDGQLRSWRRVRELLEGEGFDGVLGPGPVAVVAEQFLAADRHAGRQNADPMPLQFGLQISSFNWEGGTDDIRPRLAAVAVAAEQAGFTSLWVMDHFVQIPQVGREWDPMLEAYTTLGFLAGVTTTARLGALVTGVTYRNVALLGKTVATLDVLSGGRAVCGIGAAWFEREHQAYGYEFPPVGERFSLLEDALEVLPLLWGPGSKSYQGRVISVPDTICYPRPVQDPVPILVGGQGERKTLRLVARHAHGCNLFGDAATVSHKLSVLAEHCRAEDRDRSEIEVTHLSPVVAAPDGAALDAVIAAQRPAQMGAAAYARAANAATVPDHVGRFRQLAEAGVETAIVAMPPVPTVEAVERFAPVIEAFR